MSHEIRTDSGAVAAMWMGILGVSLLPVMLSVPAFFTARDAKERIEASGGKLGGYQEARTGWWLGLIGMVAGAAFAVWFIAGLIVAIANGGEL